jgi:hypothetical protein
LNLKWSELSNLNDNLIDEINKSNNKLSSLEKELDNYYKDNQIDLSSEYKVFKESFVFEKFWKIIDYIETDLDELNSYLRGREIKYLINKWILDRSWSYYELTDKWNKFSEYYLDEYNGESGIEDISF